MNKYNIFFCILAKNNHTMKKYILIILSLFLFSCGSFEKYKNSKSNKKETDTETKAGSETKTTTFKDLFSFEPYDNSRPMIIGRDTIVNTKIINNKETIHTHSKDTIYVKAKENEEIKEDTKHKESDNTLLFIYIGIGLFFFMFLFFVIVFFAMFNYFKRQLPKLE